MTPSPPSHFDSGLIAGALRLAQSLASRSWLGVVIVFAVAIWQRASLPWLPLADPDTWGYLNPALEHLAGNGLVQTHCRGLAYPLFLRIVLGATSSFSAIAAVQHLLGLMSGLAWLWAFRLWLDWLPENSGLHYGARWLGALCLALYLCNPATIALEAQIRPEAVFPLFGLGQIAATLVFVRARWRGGSVSAMCSAAAAAALLALVCLSLKPSWGFAALVPAAAIFFGAFGGGIEIGKAARASILAAAALAAAVWIAGVPRMAGWVPDRSCGSFLAGTLFTVHADIIAREMHARSAKGNLDAAEEDFLRKLDARIAESRALPKSAYRVLGHDADYLFYSSDTLWALPDVGANDADGRIRYLRAAYIRAAVREPWLMGSKIWNQLATAYGDASQSLFSPFAQWRALFARTNAALDGAVLPQVPPRLAQDLRDCLRAASEQAAAQPERLEPSAAPSRWLMRGPVSWLLALAALAGGAVIAASPWWGRRFPAWLPGVCTFAVFWASSVGSSLTVAVVHSFDIDRYMMLQSSTNALLLASFLGLCLALLMGCSSASKVSAAQVE